MCGCMGVSKQEIPDLLARRIRGCLSSRVKLMVDILSHDVEEREGSAIKFISSLKRKLEDASRAMPW